MSVPISLPYAIANGLPVDGTELDANLDMIVAAINTDLVAKSGAVMSGALILDSAPDTDMKAANKKYVDDSITAALPEARFSVGGVAVTTTEQTVTGWSTVTNELTTGLSQSGGVFTVSEAGLYVLNLRGALSGGGATSYATIEATAGTQPDNVALTMNGDSVYHTVGVNAYLPAGTTLRVRRRVTGVSGSATISNLYLTVVRLAKF